jgi:predicted CopG family antitoxin
MIVDYSSMKRDVPILIHADVRDALRNAKREGESYNELFMRLLRNSSGDSEVISPQSDDVLFEIREQIQALQKAVSDLKRNSTIDTTSNAHTDFILPASPAAKNTPTAADISLKDGRLMVTPEMLKEIRYIVDSGLASHGTQKGFLCVLGPVSASVIQSFKSGRKGAESIGLDAYNLLMEYGRKNCPDLLRP